MAFTHILLPDFYPGDDVLQFPLRITPPQFSYSQHDTFLSIFSILQEGPLQKHWNIPEIHIDLIPPPREEDVLSNCFCLSGHVCDENYSKNDYYIQGLSESLPPIRCSQNPSEHQDKNRNRLLDIFYFYLLTPVTRWDAARFLTLVVDPKIRHPYRKEPTATCLEDTCTDSPFLSSFEEAEKAHAFYPLMPYILRHISIFIIKTVPKFLLPPTFEGVVTLISIFWTLFMFSISAFALHSLTITIISLQSQNQTNITEDKKYEEEKVQIANEVTILFIYSPSSIFCSIPYSESTFSAFIFVGYNLALSSRYRSLFIRLGLATIPWIFACLARSNGTIQILYIVSVAISSIVHLFSAQTNNRYWSSFFFLIFGIVLSSCLLLPSILHDYMGFNRFCSASSIICTSSHPSCLFSIPSWCSNITQTSNFYDKLSWNPNHKLFRFSLYRYVQQKHWNVGFMKYYRIKNIPNFLLATPTMYLSIGGVSEWIAKSWERFRLQFKEERINSKNFLRNCAFWIWISLDELGKLHDHNFIKSSPQQSNIPLKKLLLGPLTLPHFLLLCAMTIIGMTIAHVEVSTRLICSTCPAFYWYTYLYLHQDGEKENEQHQNKSSSQLHQTHTGTLVKGHRAKFVYCFFVGYTFIGGLLFSNWLRWT